MDYAICIHISMGGEMAKRRIVYLVVALAIGSTASACADGGGGSQASGTDAGTTTSAPRRGGVVTFGEYSQPVGLDPIVATGHGTTGAIEMAAVYDTIVRYNPTTATYDNRTAQSVTSNVDATEWTLVLKPDIKFSDGTKYDAAAVKFGMNRHRSGLPGAPPCEEVVACPRNLTGSAAYMALVKDIQVVDELTVKFVLSVPWTTFPYALSAEAGMIPSPTALAKCDKTKNVNECAFNLAPVGAGPFVVSSFKPKDSLKLARNDIYWGGAAYLDGLEFIDLGDLGGTKTYESLKAGQLQAAFLRTPESIAAARADGVKGVSNPEMSGQVLLVNTGVTVTCAGGLPAAACAGKPDGPVATNPPTKDERVRRAIAAAIDPEVINQRAYSGKGLPSSALLDKQFRWDPAVPGPTLDLEAAKQLVAQAKAAGWNGKLRLLVGTQPVAQNIGLAVQTMLQQIGIDVVVEAKDAGAGIRQVIVDKDYDLAYWGLAMTSDDGAPWVLTQNFLSISPINVSGYKNAAVDQALGDLLGAKSDEARRAAYATIARRVAADVPVLPFAKFEQFTAVAANLRGVEPGNREMVFFDKAWFDK